MHWLRNSRSKDGYAALKLDMSKACDWVEWRFIEAMLGKLGFSQRWIRLSLRCITSVSYAFKFNEIVTQKTYPSRGLQAISTYIMACFRLPVSLCKEMEGICARFWWGGDNKGGVHWKSWEGLCKPKEEGGMGFRSFSPFNQALIAKQVWRMIVYPDLLASQVFKARYFRSCDVMDA